jgi:hypothetical protein
LTSLFYFQPLFIITLGSITAIALNAFFNGGKGAGDLDDLKDNAGMIA